MQRDSAKTRCINIYPALRQAPCRQRLMYHFDSPQQVPERNYTCVPDMLSSINAGWLIYLSRELEIPLFYRDSDHFKSSVSVRAESVQRQEDDSILMKIGPPISAVIIPAGNSLGEPKRILIADLAIISLTARTEPPSKNEASRITR